MKNKIIWLANTGSYSDYKVQGVFSTKKKVINFMEKFPNSEWNDPEPKVLNPDFKKYEGLKLYSIKITKDGKIIENKKFSINIWNIQDDIKGNYPLSGFDYKNNLFYETISKSYEHAKRSVIQKRA